MYSNYFPIFPDSISEFWTDDYKVFEQIYGKTSDKDLYGAQLPTTSFIEPEKPRSQASEKKERFAITDAVSDFDSYGFGDRYANLFKQLNEKTTKPPKTLSFVSYNDFKPISQYSDPETYNYLKNLEQYSVEQKIKFPKGVGGFKPFLTADDSEEEHYRSIQDILDAHEANKGTRVAEDDDDQGNQLTYMSGKSRKKANPRKKQAEQTKPRCWSGRCRKRAASSVRIRTRPYVRKVTNRWHGGY